jgi:hypothetical protein
MTIWQCGAHSSICRTCRPAPSTFSAIMVARSRQSGFLHFDTYPRRWMRRVVGAGLKAGCSITCTRASHLVLHPPKVIPLAMIAVGPVSDEQPQRSALFPPALPLCRALPHLDAAFLGREAVPKSAGRLAHQFLALLDADIAPSLSPGLFRSCQYILHYVGSQPRSRLLPHSLALDYRWNRWLAVLPPITTVGVRAGA